ncbi:MAG: biotin transporter BioY [Chloroflexi bacterium]|nr:biotin transporter BioY [Chloroflexota bacterium]
MLSAAPRLARVPPFERGITLGDFLVPIRLGERLSSRARHIVLVVVGAMFIALSANVAVPIPGSPVPVSGQTFSVLLVGGALGFRRGAASALLYLLLGLALPVYAQGRSGIEVLGTLEGGRVVLGATGGFLVGFVLASALVGRLAELGWDRSVIGSLAALAIGNVAIYLVGLPWLAVAADFGAQETLQKGLFPFLVGDAFKLVVAAALLPAGWWIVNRRPSDR